MRHQKPWKPRKSWSPALSPTLAALAAALPATLTAQVGASPAPPEHLEPGDVVVFLDPGRLTLSVGVLPRPGEPGSSRPTTGAGQAR